MEAHWETILIAAVSVLFSLLTGAFWLWCRALGDRLNAGEKRFTELEKTVTRCDQRIDDHHRRLDEHGDKISDLEKDNNNRPPNRRR